MLKWQSHNKLLIFHNLTHQKLKNTVLRKKSNKNRPSGN